MTKPTARKLLALAAPAALLFATPARADAPPPAPVTIHAGAHALVGLAALGAALRAIAIAASTRATAPMTSADGCPLPGNVGKGGAHDRCDLAQRTALANGPRR